MQQLRRAKATAASGVHRLRRLPVQAGERLEQAARLAKTVALYGAAASVLLCLLASVSAFMYATFYFAFVPSSELEGPAYPIFEPCKTAAEEDVLSRGGVERCGFLTANVSLSYRDPVLMSGQPYSLEVLLEMPESPVNRQMGMFMSCVQLRNDQGKAVRESCKSALMQYRSELLRIMETFVFAPALLTGHAAEKQLVRIEFFDDFLDDPLSPAVRMDLQILSRLVEVYGIRFVIHARFTGLRRFMFYYPVTSAVVGVMVNTTFLAVVVLLSWLRFFSSAAGESKEAEEEKEDKVVESDVDDDEEELFAEDMEFQDMDLQKAGSRVEGVGTKVAERE